MMHFQHFFILAVLLPVSLAVPSTFSHHIFRYSPASLTLRSLTSNKVFDLSRALSSPAVPIYFPRDATVSIDHKPFAPPRDLPLSYVHTDGVFRVAVSSSSPRTLISVRHLRSGLSFVRTERDHHFRLNDGPLFGEGVPNNKFQHLEHALNSTSFSSSVHQLRSASCSDSSSAPLNLRIALAFDTPYCTVHKSRSGALAALNDLIASVSKIYDDNTCIRPSIIHVDGHCKSSTDRYSELLNASPAKCLDGFVKIWTSTSALQSIERDVAFFVTGGEDGTSTAGRAYLRAVCSDYSGFGYAEGDSVPIFAHELGHTLGADHTSVGIMMGVLGPGTEEKLSSDSVRQIADYVDTKASCLQPMSGKKAKPSMSTNAKPSATPSSKPSQSSTPIPSASTSPVPKEEEKKQEKKTSAEPSKSSTPTPTPTPTLSSSPSPDKSADRSPSDNKPTRPGSCAASVQSSKVPFSCTSFKDLGRVMTSSGDAGLRVRQVDGMFEIRFNAVNSDTTLITAALRLGAATDEVRSVRATDQKVGSEALSIMVDTNDITSGSDCCGSTLDLSVGVIVRKESKTVINQGGVEFPGTTAVLKAGFGHFDISVECKDPCTGSVSGEIEFTAQRCPVCVESSSVTWTG